MTKAQRLASDPKRSIWVTANAGTGKTKVLTDRVLRLLLDGNSHHSILCLTYTKAAASEMLERISSRLMRWTMLEKEQLRQDLHQLINHLPTKDQMNEARRLFAVIRSSAEPIKIQTIHAFCQGLLQRFPLESGVPPSFDLIDDTMAEQLRRRAKDQLLLQLIQQQDIKPDLQQAFDYFLAKSTHYSIEEALDSMIFSLREIQEIMDFHQDIPSYEKFLRQKFDLDESIKMDDIQQKIVSVDYDPAQVIQQLLEGGVKATAFAEKLAQIMQQPVDGRASEASAYCQLFFTQKDEPRQLHVLVTKKLQKTYPDLLPLLEQEQQRITALKAQQQSLLTVCSTVHYMTVAREVITHYDLIKTSSGYIDYEDVIAYALQLLQQSDISSWILYQLNEHVRHILLDEAQDTSPKQWQLLHHLSEDFFSGQSGYEQEHPASLFVVGDEKQSIYSFQGASIQAYFNELQRIRRLSKENASFAFEEVAMNLSFRSSEAVLHLVDAVSNQSVFHHDALTKNPDPIQHTTFRTKQAGVAACWPVITIDKESQNIMDWPLPISQQTVHNAESLLAAQIADNIQQWIEERRLLPNHQRPVRPEDIIILVEKRTDFIPLLRQALQSRQIEVAPADRMLLCNELAVKDLLALTRFLLLPEDDLSLAELLKSPLFSLSEEELYHLAVDREQHSLWHQLKKSEHSQIIHRLNHWLAKVDFISPFALYHDVLDSYEGRRLFNERLGVGVEEVLNEFLALVLQFEASRPHSLQGFMEWFEQHGKIFIKREQSNTGNALRIMTIHASKGLQAPIVILADINKKTPILKPPLLSMKDHMILWTTKTEERNHYYSEMLKTVQLIQQEEKIRQLYVAMTRAEDEFYACGLAAKSAKQERWIDIITHCLAQMGEAIEHQPDQIEYRYSLYSDQQVSSRAATKQPSPPLPPTMPAFLSRVITQDMPSTKDNTIEAIEEQHELTQDNSAAMQRGIIIHELLQLLAIAPTEQRSCILRQHLDRLIEAKEGAAAIDKAEILHVMDRIMSNESLSFLFDRDAFSELGVSFNGELGRLDRIIRISEQHLLLVDYKTSRNPPKLAEHIPASYREQMQRYYHIVRQIFPTHSIDCAILWIDNANLMYLPSELLREPTQAVMRQAQDSI